MCILARVLTAIKQLLLTKNAVYLNTTKTPKLRKVMQRHAKTRKDTHRRAKTRKFLRVFVRLCVTLSTSNVFLLPLRVFARLCPSLSVFARLCVSLCVFA